jgi:glycosyltransferase involved in cell wall biosynthesis
LVGTVIEQAARRVGVPIGIEVVGDPWDSLAPGNVNHAGLPVFRLAAALQMRRQCSRASAVSYVTRETLQRRYPPAPGAFTTQYSSEQLPAQAFVCGPRSYEKARTRTSWRLVFIGSLAQHYKGLATLLEAVRECIDRGVMVELEVLGEGSCKPLYAEQARMLGISSHVRFLGRLRSGFPVWKRLRQADLFVLPSYTEGLPRAMIEAMASGLPCIGTSVGGIVELLPAEDRVPPRDSHALAEKMLEVISDPARMERMSERNLKVAGIYEEERLQRRRLDFYRAVRSQVVLSGSNRGRG